jgi:type IV pilus assembly protein PilA
MGTISMKRQKGFSLIELLIVVAIILIIAAIAIPNLLRSKMVANEASAVGTLSAITTAAVVYTTMYDNGFPPSLGALGGPAGNTAATCDAALLIDTVLSGGVGSGTTASKSGYTFNFVAGPANSKAGVGCASPGVGAYMINAIPITLGSTGQRSFCADESGAIHVDKAGADIPDRAACDALPTL